MRASCSRISSLILLTSLVLTSGQLWAEQKKPADPPPKGSIIKWVDEKGVTHYGDRMPVQDANRNNTVLNKQGMVVKKNQPANPGATIVDKENPEQQRHDRALLATYSSEQEIDLTRDRSLQTDELAVKGLQQELDNAQSKMNAYKKVADGFVKRNKPVMPDLVEDMQNQRVEIAKLEGQIAQRRQVMQATRQRFDNDKQRYLELKPHNTDTATPAPSAPKAAETAR